MRFSARSAASFLHRFVARHVGRPEAEGQQLVHAALDEIIRRPCHDDVQLRPAELEQRLTADPAGRRDLFVHLAPAGPHDGNVGEPGHALTHRLEQRRALGAAGRGKGGVLHIAAGEDAAVLRPQRRADQKVRIGRIGPLAGLQRIRISSFFSSSVRFVMV